MQDVNWKYGGKKNDRTSARATSKMREVECSYNASRKKIRLK